MNIPEEAVEAAARVRHDTYRRAVAERVGDGAPTTPWENIPERWRSDDREAVRVYLEAAAPFIAAQALRDALDEVDTMRSGPAAAPYVSATKAVLRSIADQWDEQ